MCDICSILLKVHHEIIRLARLKIHCYVQVPIFTFAHFHGALQCQGDIRIGHVVDVVRVGDEAQAGVVHHGPVT